jgi:hypothetical protein
LQPEARPPSCVVEGQDSLGPNEGIGLYPVAGEGCADDGRAGARLVKASSNVVFVEALRNRDCECPGIGGSRGCRESAARAAARRAQSEDQPASDDGRTWLAKGSGMFWLVSDQGRDWIETRDGMEWFRSREAEWWSHNRPPWATRAEVQRTAELPTAAVASEMTALRDTLSSLSGSSSVGVGYLPEPRFLVGRAAVRVYGRIGLIVLNDSEDQSAEQLIERVRTDSWLNDYVSAWNEPLVLPRQWPNPH